MSQKFPVNNFEWIWDTSQFNEDLIKSYKEDSDEGYFLEGDVQYSNKLVEKLVVNLHEETEYVIHIRNLKQTLDDGMVLKRVNRVIKFLKMLG